MSLFKTCRKVAEEILHSSFTEKMSNVCLHDRYNGNITFICSLCLNSWFFIQELTELSLLFWLHNLSKYSEIPAFEYLKTNIKKNLDFTMDKFMNKSLTSTVLDNIMLAVLPFLLTVNQWKERKL